MHSQRVLIKCPWCGKEYKGRLGLHVHLRSYCKAILVELQTRCLDELSKCGFYHSDMVEGKDYVICQLCKVEERSDRVRQIASPHFKKMHAIDLSQYKQMFPESQIIAWVVKEKFKQTSLEHFGVEHPSQSEEIKEKKVQTCLKNFGVKHPLQSEEIQVKYKQTCLKNLGVENPFLSDMVKMKSKQTWFKRYGVEYPNQSEEIKQQKVEASLAKYGVEYPSQLESVKEKSKQTCLDHYGVEYAMQSEGVQEKHRRTCLENHGVVSPLQSEEIQVRYKQTCLKNLGVENPFLSDMVKMKSKQTCFTHYGVEYPSQSEEIQEKSRQTRALKSEIFAYLGRNGDTWYLHTINVPEAKFNTESPDNLMYTGDKVFYISTPDHPGYKSANPDFLVMPIKETKKVIEIFGVYIHSTRLEISREEAEQEKITQYAQVGYQCLIIWDDELLKDQEHLDHQIQRAKDFCGTYWEHPFKEDLSFLKEVKIKRTKHKQILSENITRLLARTESTEELEKKKIKLCREVIKDQNLEKYF